MKCKCREERENKLIDKGYADACLDNVVITIPEGKSILTIPFTYRKKKNETEYFQKHYTISIRATYCPFCGKKCGKETD